MTHSIQIRKAWFGQPHKAWIERRVKGMVLQEHKELCRFNVLSLIWSLMILSYIWKLRNLCISRRGDGEELLEADVEAQVDGQRKSLRRKKGKCVGEQARLK